MDVQVVVVPLVLTLVLAVVKNHVWVLVEDVKVHVLVLVVGIVVDNNTFN